MGEFIRNPVTGEEIKIGTCVGDTCRYFYTREQLQDFKRQGFRGYYAEKWDETLERALTYLNALYPLPQSCPFDPNVHVIIVDGNGELEHDPVIVQMKGNRGSVYTWVDLPCKQRGMTKIYAVMVGMRYDEQGRERTIFECDCCHKPFSITKDEAAKLKEEHPYWAKWIKPNPQSED